MARHPPVTVDLPGWLHDAYRGRRVAVLGASGFIGRWVARMLLEVGADPVLFVRSAPPAASRLGDFGVYGDLVEVDVRDHKRLTEMLRRAEATAVFNLCGYGVDPTERDPELANLVNARLPQIICDAVRGHADPSWSGQQIVHAGSALEYGISGENLDEDGPAEPDTLYGRSKLAGTQALAEACRRDGTRGLTARLFTVYGWGERPQRLLPALLRAAQSRATLDLTAGMQERDFVYVEDVAVGLLRLALSSAPPGEIVNLASGHLTSVRRFTEIAAGILGIQAPCLRFGMLPTRAEEMRHAPVVPARLTRLTDWKPATDIPSGIRQTEVLARLRPVPPEPALPTQ